VEKVQARSVPTPHSFPDGSEVTRIEYALGNLQVHVEGSGDATIVIIEFAEVLAFRVLDERDLMEFWPICSTPNGGLFEIKSGGWLSQEAARPGSLVAAVNPDAKEYLVTGEDDCVSVLTRTPPVVRCVGH